MIVPKKNLQDKWLKELRNFAQRNYIKAGDYFRTASMEQSIIQERLQPIPKEALFIILRMTSFSSVISSRNQLKEYFKWQVFGNNPFCNEILNKAKEKKYFIQDNRGKLLRLIACLLNAMSARVDCLIIDEAHNYKYGPGEGGSGSARNQVTARFLGAVKDKEIMEDFPELKPLMKYPLAKKVICLSATPKDRDLWEIPNQLSCFTTRHPLKRCEDTEEIKSLLSSFLIRGNMEYTLAGTTYSRNQCRYEHRRGNVIKAPDAAPIQLGNDLENVFWQLLQYKSIRHLSLKANASFEIGMLAGFESYELDMDKKIAMATNDEGEGLLDKEYEYTRHRAQKISEDGNVIRQLITSYKDAFANEPPPHPKLSKLQNELLAQFKKQEKSLIFVRRIATVDELLHHLLRRYDLELVNDGYLQLPGKWKRYQTPAVIALRQACADFYANQKRIKALESLSEHPAIEKWAAKIYFPVDTSLPDLLRYCYDLRSKPLVALLNDFLVKGKFRASLISAAIAAIKSSFPTWREQFNAADSENVPDDEPQLRTDSFFKNYFKKNQAGYRFKQKIYRENWFDLNYYLLLAGDKDYSAIVLKARQQASALLNMTGGKMPHLVFSDHQEAFKKALLAPDIAKPVRKPIKGKNPLLAPTFLTQFLISACHEEWLAWKSARPNSLAELLIDMAALQSLLQSVFQHSSGLLPAFIAESRNNDFTKDLIGLLQAPDAPFHFVLLEIKTILRDFSLIIAVNFQDRDPRKIAKLLESRSPVVGASGHDKNRSAIAARFRMPGFPYALIATDIFHEGEDLHTYCQAVYHYGIAWNPSGIEQRTGRIDRINSLSYRKLIAAQKLAFDHQIQVFYPYLTRSVEVNQVVKILGHVNRFLEDFNNIEDVQQYDSQVPLAEVIAEDNIPQAITRRIHSKYDIDYFEDGLPEVKTYGNT